MAKWECPDHDTEIEVSEGTPKEEVLKNVPPVCPKTGKEMERIE